MSIEFCWRPEDFRSLVHSCDSDSSTQYILEYMPEDGMMVEAGCGLGRYVKFLSERGFDIVGIDLNNEAVAAVKKLAPELDVRQGNVLDLPFENESIAGILSLGVVDLTSSTPR